MAFILARLGQTVIVVLVAALVSFALFTYVGDPVNNMLGQDRTQEDVQRLRSRLGLDQPFPVQYFRFLQNAAKGMDGGSQPAVTYPPR